jgi:nitrite reductase/ring-hydroxylating ferredoxin subunit
VSDDGWYAVSLSTGIDAGRSAGTQLFGKEIVLWRDIHGVAHAWEDRCPHRGMRLSFGFVRGDRIACLYHGWQYDAAGQCRFIPAHPELAVPSTIRASTYFCQERLGMVWMCSSAAATGGPQLTIDERAVTPVRSIHIDCPFGATVETLTNRGKMLDESMALVSTRVDELPLLIAVQPYGATKTALHIVIEGAHDIHDSGARSAAATWAEQTRRDLESSPGIAADTVMQQRVAS